MQFICLLQQLLGLRESDQLTQCRDLTTGIVALVFWVIATTRL